jgi:hypothetical protein
VKLGRISYFSLVKCQNAVIFYAKTGEEFELEGEIERIPTSSSVSP